MITSKISTLTWWLTPAPARTLTPMIKRMTGHGSVRVLNSDSVHEVLNVAHAPAHVGRPAAAAASACAASGRATNEASARTLGPDCLR